MNVATNATHVHAKEARDDIDRQRQYRNHRQGKQRAVALFVEVGGDFFLQQLDPFAYFLSVTGRRCPATHPLDSRSV